MCLGFLSIDHQLSQGVDHTPPRNTRPKHTVTLKARSTPQTDPIQTRPPPYVTTLHHGHNLGTRTQNRTAPNHTVPHNLPQTSHNTFPRPSFHTTPHHTAPQNNQCTSIHIIQQYTKPLTAHTAPCHLVLHRTSPCRTAPPECCTKLGWQDHPVIAEDHPSNRRTPPHHFKSHPAPKDAAPKCQWTHKLGH